MIKLCVAAIFLWVTALGCRRSQLPPDTVPQPPTGPTHELTIDHQRANNGVAFTVEVPVEADLSARYPAFIKWGEGTTIDMMYFPDASTLGSLDEPKRWDAALVGKAFAPEGYAVAAPWRGTVIEQRMPGATRWSVSYSLWDGKAAVLAHVSFLPNDPKSEANARAVFNSAIRTVKPK